MLALFYSPAAAVPAVVKVSTPGLGRARGRPKSTAAARQLKLGGIAAATESISLERWPTVSNDEDADSWVGLQADGSVGVWQGRPQGEGMDHGPFTAEQAQLVARTLRRLPAAHALLAPDDDALAIADPTDAEVRAALAGVRAARRRTTSLQNLQEWLGLDTPPRLIESFDVSHMGGEFTVVSCARIVDACPEPTRHLRWPVSSAPASDDCAGLAEGLIRRFGKRKANSGRDWRRNKGKNDDLPDLIVIDGGKGQLHTAMRALSTTRARDVPLVALAKGNETVFTLGDGEGVEFAVVGDGEASLPGKALEPPPGGAESSALLLLRLSRDAAHSTALAGHRHLRESAALTSALSQLKTTGVGAARRSALLEHFGSFAALCDASVEELQEVPGIGKRLATSLAATLQEAAIQSTPPQPFDPPPSSPPESIADTPTRVSSDAGRVLPKLKPVKPLYLPEDPKWPPLSPTAAAIARPRRGRRLDATRRKRAEGKRGEDAAARDVRLLRDSLKEVIDGMTASTPNPVAEAATVGNDASAVLPWKQKGGDEAMAAASAAASAALDRVGADAVAAARAARRVAFESGEHGDRMPGDGGDGGNGDAALSFGNRPTRAIRPFELVSPWPPSSEQAAVVSNLKSSLDAGLNRLVLKGATGTGKTFAMSQLIEDYGKPTLLLAPNKVLAAQLWSELVSFFPNNAVEYFVSYYDYYRPESYAPVADVYLQKSAAVNEDIDRMRHACTASLRSRSDVIVVASVSCIYGLGAPELYQSAALSLEAGDTLPSLAHLVARLAELSMSRLMTARAARTLREASLSSRPSLAILRWI